MEAPAKAENESIRLATLRSLNILDSSPEERFDRVTRLAKRILGVPIALISLIDDERQWFKSCVGLDVSETSRDVSFCGHAILGEEMFVIPDASLDLRFHDNPLVTGPPNIRFYAGFPLSVPNGSKLGTLCLIDRSPRVLDEEDRALIVDLARIAEQEIAAVQLASMDELTLISNRRGFKMLGQHSLHVARRLNKPATLFFFDLNGFKPINDRFGHAEGDRALCAFAEVMRQVFRNSDVIGRHGGDEFVALMTATEANEAATVLQRLKLAINELNETKQRGYRIEYSVGTSEFDPDRHPSIDALIDEADALMYLQKRDKRPS